MKRHTCSPRQSRQRLKGFLQKVPGGRWDPLGGGRRSARRKTLEMTAVSLVLRSASGKEWHPVSGTWASGEKTRPQEVDSNTLTSHFPTGSSWHVSVMRLPGTATLDFWTCRADVQRRGSTQRSQPRKSADASHVPREPPRRATSAWTQRGEEPYPRGSLLPLCALRRLPGSTSPAGTGSSAEGAGGVDGAHCRRDERQLTVTTYYLGEPRNRFFVFPAWPMMTALCRSSFLMCRTETTSLRTARVALSLAPRRLSSTHGGSPTTSRGMAATWTPTCT